MGVGGDGEGGGEGSRARRGFDEAFLLALLTTSQEDELEPEEAARPAAGWRNSLFCSMFSCCVLTEISPIFALCIADGDAALVLQGIIMLHSELGGSRLICFAASDVEWEVTSGEVSDAASPGEAEAGERAICL